ncbi:MAG: magnesium transporter MgtE N-terminal domain-containing protein [Acidimicrobiales bacterium]
MLLRAEGPLHRRSNVPDPARTVLLSGAVDWADLHLTSARGRALQLRTPGSGLHRLGSHELATMMAHLPTASAAHMLDSVSSEAAAGALSASHPAVGARLLHGVSGDTATSLVNSLPPDDAVSLLRHLRADAAENMLSTAPSDRCWARRWCL